MRKRPVLRALALEDIATSGEVMSITEFAPDQHHLSTDEHIIYKEEIAKIVESLRRQAKRLIHRTERNEDEFADQESGYHIKKAKFFAILVAVRDQQRKDGAPESDLMTESQLRDYLFHYAPKGDSAQQDWLDNANSDDAASEILDYIWDQV